MVAEESIITADVAISGGSYAGLAMALALAKAFGPDLRVCIIERQLVHASGAGDPRASAISAGSRRMLAALGVWARVADAAQDVLEIQLTDSGLESGVRPVLLTYDNVLEGGEPASSIVPNAALGEALESAVAEVATVHRIRPAKARGLTIAEPLVTVDVGEGRTVRAALLIAADGRRSQLREAAGIKCVGWSYGQAGIVTRVAHERPHLGRAIQHFLPGGPFAILPLKGNASCITWSEDAERARTILASSDADFLAEVDKRFAGRYGALTLEGPRASWPLELHLARRYVAPRFALIGDAAHGVHPIAGQGLNLAFRDVAALAEVLVEAARLGLGVGDANALAHYESWRRFDSALSAATFDGLNRLFSNDWTMLRSMREAGLAVVDRLPELKRFLVAEAAGVTGEVPRLLEGKPL